MQYKSLFLASLMSSVLGAPVAYPEPQDGLLKGLSPAVVTLLNGLVGPGAPLGGLGLAGVPAPVGGILDTASDDLKKRQAPGLLENLSPDVVTLLNGLLAPPSVLGGLGLEGVSVPVGGIVTTLGKGLRKRQTPGLLENLSPDVVALLNGLLAPPSALSGLGLAGVSAPVGGVVTTLGKGLKRRQTPGLLENLSPDVVALLNGLLAPSSALSGLGLAGVSAPVGGVVTTLGKGLKKE